MQIGRTSLAEFSLYQPVSTSHDWFVEPGVVVRSSLEDLYADGDTIARFDLQHIYATAEVGRIFARLAEMRVGLRGGKARAQPDIATPAITGTGKENQIGWTAEFVFDTRNTPLLPTHGWLSRINYFNSDKSLNSENNYQRLDSLVQAAFRVRNDVIIASVAGGTAFSSDLPQYESFVLGGPTSFPGFGIGELRGSDYWLGSVAYLRKVADISKLFGQALYAGLQLQAGAMTEMPQLNSRGLYDGTLYSGSIFLTARTPIGPATLSLAGASINSWVVTISFGRPIEEGSILDFAR
jgi:outer membrane protein assembly factor BamA